MESIDPSKAKAALAILNEYRLELDALFALAIEAREGLILYNQKICKDAHQQQIADGLDARGRQILYVRRGTGHSEQHHQHRAMYDTVSKRTAPDGSHCHLLYRSVIISIYAKWEHTRKKFGEVLGLEEDLKCQVFGDLRHYRNASAHMNPILRDETKVLLFVPVGELIELSHTQFEDLFRLLIDGLNEIARKYLDKDDIFKLDIPTNSSDATRHDAEKVHPVLISD